ncbi:hypothetical protein PRIPAC_70427 [Pristionchus pacificus]|uniref:Uncharacterized protein n=1 Tax=Pristionchus pacificus TaxID=54126 RepID=A0A2A6CF03_PRIPA|nr:hypothetical protein PRIPAC_70427 [Pristionchus pacificus]|eukprot:PDM76667.1 hypothetical protein PRIPAC_42062 [Pristionchus pacificus]
MPPDSSLHLSSTSAERDFHLFHYPSFHHASARRPPGLIGRYRPIQSTIVALDVARCLLIPLLISISSFSSSHQDAFSTESLLRSALVATVTSESSVMIMGFLYRLLTLKGSRLNGLLSAKWVMLIILLTIVEGTAQSFLQTYSQALQQSANSIHPLARYALLASSYLFECYEAAKFIIMISIGYRTHQFIRCAIFTKQATRMHRQGLKTIGFQALTHFIFSFLPLILLPRSKK